MAVLNLRQSDRKNGWISKFMRCASIAAQRIQTARSLEKQGAGRSEEAPNRSGRQRIPLARFVKTHACPKLEMLTKNSDGRDLEQGNEEHIWMLN
jgi:hypothetical protein